MNTFNTKNHTDNLQFLYKYYSIFKEDLTFIERIFTHNEIYFSPPRTFNDPFDSNIQLCYEGSENDWEKHLRYLFKKFKPELTIVQINLAIEKIIKENRFERALDNLPNSYLDEMGTFCMSERKDHLLMWAHYAVAHTGLCLEFLATSTTPFFGRAQKIGYADNYPKVNFFKSSRDEQMQAILLTKAKAWEYEQEWRIIEHDKGPGTYVFPEELLTGVILGCKMTDYNRQKIKNLVLQRKHRPKLYQSKIKRDEFNLDIIEIDN